MIRIFTRSIGIVLFLLSWIYIFFPLPILNAATLPKEGHNDAQGNDSLKEMRKVEGALPEALPEYIKQLGKLGLNFDLEADEQGLKNKPFIYCQQYNKYKCEHSDPNNCTEMVKCYATASTHYLGCMAVLVHNISVNQSVFEPAIKDCWSQDKNEMQECHSDDECIMTTRKTDKSELRAKFCCCRTHGCNNKFVYSNVSEFDIELESQPALESIVDIPKNRNKGFIEVLSIGIIPFLFMCIFIACIILIRTLRHKFLKKTIKHIKPSNKYGSKDLLIQRVPEITLNDGSKFDFNDMHFIEVISNGRFGEVRRVFLGNQILAAKIFAWNEEDNWINEMSLYSLKAIRKNENIAEFISGFQWDKKYWLLIKYYKKGSLFDFLKANTITLMDSVRMISSLLNGLAFLHEEISSGEDMKPTIVHRDIKSKNILVKDDLSTCITDFGLALRCESKSIGADQNHDQVGTRRYMSPEVLEGATEFSNFAFQQIDVYAAALVIWEILSRTSIPGVIDDAIPPFMLPYENEVGPNPSIGQIRELVAVQKYRPQVRKEIYHNQISSSIVRTMVEMWDHEPDGRITSSCAKDRSKLWIQEISSN